MDRYQVVRLMNKLKSENPGKIGGDSTHTHIVADHIHTVDPPNTSLSYSTAIAALDVTGLFPVSVHAGSASTNIGVFNSGIQTSSVSTDEVNHNPLYYELAFIMKL